MDPLKEEGFSIFGERGGIHPERNTRMIKSAY